MSVMKGCDKSNPYAIVFFDGFDNMPYFAFPVKGFLGQFCDVSKWLAFVMWLAGCDESDPYTRLQPKSSIFIITPCIRDNI